ncbi:Secreted protein OS=Streptomyces griseomycini OX=66895 GN=FHS37_006547 PE=4 SV=1 [Streptomyces griseomycini]
MPTGTAGAVSSMATVTKTQVGAAERLLRETVRAGRDAESTGLCGGAALRAVERARPARSAAAKVAAAGGADDDTAAYLRELAGRHLGGDAARWCGLHDALAGHRGSLPELLAASPVPAVSGDALRPPAPRSVHRTLGLLLEHTEPRHAAAAFAALPERVTTELLAGGTLPAPTLVAAVIDHGDTRTRAALARHPRLDTRFLARLVAVGDAQVAAAVYRNPRTTQSLRRTVVERLDAVPLDDALRAELTAPHSQVPRTWLDPLLGSGDPQLVVPALRRGVRQVAQQYALLRIWERTGPDAVRTLLDDPAAAAWLSRAVVDTVTEALAAPDGDGPRRLRAQGEPYEDPARLPALLATARGTSSLRDLLSEPYAHDLDALAAAHAATPFMPKACEELARHEAASDAQRQAFRLSVLNEPWRAAGRRAGNTTSPAQRLAQEKLDENAAVWAEGMVAAGLLDPIELIGTAHPAAHALAALVRLAERDLLGTAAVADLRALSQTHLGERTRAWTALDALLPEHEGTVAELIAEAGKAPHGTAAEVITEPEPPASAPPSRPMLHRPERAHALAALDLLYSLAPDGAPRPKDPEVLRALTEYEPATAPALATPRWFAAACAAHGIPASKNGFAHEAPSLAQVRAQLPETYGSGAQHTERAYVQGVLPADELLTLLPARRLLLLPYDWRRLAFADAWRAALARRLRAELGTDPDAWLRLAATVTASEASSEGLTWAELVERAQSGAGPAASAGTSIGRTRPGTPDEAIKLLEHGDHLWAWPEGTLLCLADAEVVDAVLPRLGPDGPWLLAAYLLRHDRTPRAVLDRLLADRDHDALRVLAAQSRWMERSGAVERLVDLDDPEVDLALLRHWTPAPAVHRIVTRSRPGTGRPSLGARVLADWRTGGTARPAGGLMWLCSAEPDLVEELLVREGSRLGLGHQLTGCLRLFEHGGADRLARLAGRDVLGRSATTVCAKALASADPAAVLRARLDRELAPERLIRKLRRARHAPHARHLVESLPPGESVDWAALEAAHAQEPLPYWRDIVRLDGVPEDVRLRHAALLPEPGPDGLPGSARLTRERARHGLGGRFHCAPTTQLDGLLTAGLLDAADLVHHATPAARLLAYLGAAARRTDAPPKAAEARALLTDLVRTGLGTDPAAWHRVAERLTGLDPEWNPLSTVAELLAHKTC